MRGLRGRTWTQTAKALCGSLCNLECRATECVFCLVKSGESTKAFLGVCLLYKKIYVSILGFNFYLEI